MRTPGQHNAISDIQVAEAIRYLDPDAHDVQDPEQDLDDRQSRLRNGTLAVIGAIVACVYLAVGILCACLLVSFIHS